MILVLHTLFFIMGAAKGLCDSIMMHDAFKFYTRFWQNDSWKDHKLFGLFVMNAWHVFDLLRACAAMAAAVLVAYFGLSLSWWWCGIPVAHWIGFKISYRTK